MVSALAVHPETRTSLVPARTSSSRSKDAEFVARYLTGNVRYARRMHRLFPNPSHERVSFLPE